MQWQQRSSIIRSRFGPLLLTRMNQSEKASSAGRPCWNEVPCGMSAKHCKLYGFPSCPLHRVSKECPGDKGEVEAVSRR